MYCNLLAMTGMTGHIRLRDERDQGWYGAGVFELFDTLIQSHHSHHPMNITNNFAKPTTPLKISLTTPSPDLPVTPYHTMPFEAETDKALEAVVDWWRIRSNDPRVQIKGMRIPGPRSGKTREQE